MTGGLVPALVSWLRSPEIWITPSDEVLALRAQVADLQAQLSKAKEQLRRVETLYGQECYLNLRLEDELRSLGVRRRR